ncbi:MAG TPA: MFS transporter [Acidimicrobiales bacterium]|nr:MFS transporter [Acidimicrobiales bacterium]
MPEPPSDDVVDLAVVRRRGLRGLREAVAPVGLFPLTILFGLNLVDEFDRVAFGALTPEIRDYFDLSNASIVTIASLAGGLAILMAVPIGYLADRTNRVRLSRVAALVWGTASLVTGLIPVLAVLIIARFVSGVGRVVNEPVHPSLLGDYYRPEQLPLVFATHRWANQIGLIGGPIAGGLALLFDDWRPVFIILSIPTFVLIVLTGRLREPHRGPVVEDAAEEADVPFGEAFRRIRAVQSLRRTWLAAFLFGSGSLSFASAFLSLYLEEVYRLGSLGRGLMQVLFGIGGSAGLVLGGRLSARAVKEGRPEQLAAVTGLMIVGFGAGALLMVVSPWLVVSAVMILLLAVGAAGFLPAYLTMVALVSPPRLRSQAFSYSLLFFALGGLVLGRTAATVGDDHGMRWGIALLAVFIVAGGLTEITARGFIRRDIAEAQRSAAAQDEARRGGLLVIRGLDVAYDQVQVLFGVDLDVQEGEILALLGTNGAGKSTLLKAISGVVDPIGGAIYFEQRDITHADANTTAGLGLVQIPGGRGIFPGLSVADNLRSAGWMYRRDPAYRKEAVERVLGYFPILRARWDLPAGSMSGGEQQMLSLSMAFVARPSLLLIDELSLGLAPTVVDSLLDIVRAIHRNGTTVVLVEQSVNTALKIADRAAFMEKGEIRFSGPTAELLNRPDVLRAVFLQGAASAIEANVADVRDDEGEIAAEAQERLEVVQARGERSRRRHLRRAPIVLETVGLTKRYGGITAVNSVDLQVREGEILGLLGPNGAGKTTIFDLISGFAPANGGQVFLHGVDVTALPPHRRAALGLGRTFQDARLWSSLTVTEALACAFERQVTVRATLPAMFGIDAVADSEARILRRVHEVIDMMGLDAYREKFVSELSTGTRRMVEIAAMVAHRPSVLILDEPSSGIAQRETEALGPLLRQVRAFMGCSLLVIEHDMPLITSLADRIVALEQGAVVAVGTPSEIIHHPRVVQSYLGSMADELTI